MGGGLCRVADVGVCYFDVAVDGGWLLAVAFEENVHGVCWGLRGGKNVHGVCWGLSGGKNVHGECWGLRVKGGDFVRCADSIDLTFNSLTLMGFVDARESIR